MGQGHSHGDEGHGSAAHDHTAGANARSLTIALAITGAFLLAELAGAYWFNSLALLSDAAHMFTDAAALGIALLAIKIGQRPADVKRTYGYRRFEILRSLQSKPEMHDPARATSHLRPPLEHEHVPAARRLRLDKIFILVHRLDSQDGLIEA